MPGRPASSFARGFLLAVPLALLLWVAIALIFMFGGAIALVVADLPLMPWSPRS